jgi:hypothetical protein
VTPSMSTKCSTAELIAHETVTKPLPNTKWSAESRVSTGAIKGVVRGIKGFWWLDEMGYNVFDEQEHSCHDPALLSHDLMR